MMARMEMKEQVFRKQWVDQFFAIGSLWGLQGDCRGNSPCPGSHKVPWILIEGFGLERDRNFIACYLHMSLRKYPGTPLFFGTVFTKAGSVSRMLVVTFPLPLFYLLSVLIIPWRAIFLADL
jgi:hypothetical protein